MMLEQINDPVLKSTIAAAAGIGVLIIGIYIGRWTKKEERTKHQSDGKAVAYAIAAAALTPVKQQISDMIDKATRLKHGPAPLKKLYRDISNLEATWASEAVKLSEPGDA